jgi:hypothetical protein
MSRLWPALLPELRRFPPSEQDEALRVARRTDLDLIELLGMAAGLVVVTAVTRYTLSDANMSTRFAATLVNFVVALPLLVIALGPFHVRRLRRGLREQLRSRGLR